MHTHTHTHKAIELDPDNENYKSNLETVEQQLKSDTPPGAEGGASQGATGGPQAQPPPGGFPGTVYAVLYPTTSLFLHKQVYTCACLYMFKEHSDNVNSHALSLVERLSLFLEVQIVLIEKRNFPVR